MARVVGLDLGSHSVKAVVVESALRGQVVKQVVEVPLPEDGEKSARLASALTALTAQGVLPADTVVTALPGLTLATHPVQLPFSDPKKVEQTLPGEVEEKLPYELSDAAYDYQVTHADEKGASLIVGVSKRGELGPLLAQLKEAKADPRIVTHAGLAYQHVLAQLPTQPPIDGPEPAVGIVDLGHERVCLAIGRPGVSVDVTRIIPGGGQQLTKALAKEFNVSLAEAQRWKEQHAALGSHVVGADAERAAAAITRALQPVLRELRPTIKAYTAKTHRPVGKLYLCGGTAKLPGIAEQLAADLGVPVELLPLAPELRDVAQGLGVSAAQAWALSLRGSASGAKVARFNLRRGELAFKSDFDFVKERIGQLVALGVILLVLLIASSIVRNAVLEKREKQLDAMLCETTQRVLGKCERDYLRAENMMTGKESPTAGIPKRSAATLLAEVTTRIPHDMSVKLEQVVVDLDRISLKCEAEASKTMEDLMAALKTYKCFKEIKEGKLEKSKDGSKVSFRLDIQVECPDDAAAGEG